MRSGTTVGWTGDRLKAMAVAAALACGAATAMAADATLKITAFTVSAADFSGNFAWATDAYQSFSMGAQEAGGMLGTASDSFNADNWNLGLNRLAQTVNTKATGNTVQFTDGATGLTTAGFNLFGQANAGVYPATSPPNYANASGLQSGAFVLLDGNGSLASGTITFDVYYDMSVASARASTSNYSQTVVNVLASSDGGGSNSFSDGLLSSGLAGGNGATSGHFTWTYTLAAGQAAYYTLSGSAIGSAVPVPEPAAVVLMGAGLAGIAALARRRRSAV